ncbi:MAG: hypothetical protein ABI679_11535 [Gemmatimonadota bacterium]
MASLLLMLPSALVAQNNGPAFASLAIGLGVQEHPASISLPRTGINASYRLGYRFSSSWAGAFELVTQHIGESSIRPAGFMCPANTNCVAPTGPVDTRSIGLGAYRSTRVAGARVSLGVTPNWTWFSRSTVRPSAHAFGIALGSNIATGGPGPLHPMIEARYFRYNGRSSSLTSSFQVGLGLSWH